MLKRDDAWITKEQIKYLHLEEFASIIMVDRVLIHMRELDEDYPWTELVKDSNS
jgi:hypothetical protein